MEDANQPDSKPRSLEAAQASFLQGQGLFERGEYREAIQALARAIALVDTGSKLAGEVGLWLALAYDAAGDRQEALGLCRRLATSPYQEVRKQSRRLLSILEAPKLSVNPNWMTQIPDLNAVQGESYRAVGRSGASGVKAPHRPSPFDPASEIDFSQVETQDNGFIGVAFALSIALIGGLIWMGLR
ncbi:tetratricopeptide repeat protein [Lyngbya confervoides]|uniref:Tetratricopeptide repeat protein n=1 Tax=Lyngbya confervoides BDU141951 TaxID=1574623 RepID=A0ABD4T1H9_9CYAN|nr:tetratricopeptide repeat protein [Lyngbya confervoides]MCM1982501.1 tetratricopeptide repeat protein [Lyngbya confervoides BDU141951]